MLHDVYIGDRFHGGVAALQAGQPTIFLKHDNRVAELTEHFGLLSAEHAEIHAQGAEGGAG
ncbi:polysaccharide pyruvyl transferase family protein (plasmid) [Phaeobacter sp. BS23]|uniref:polysaccharide pyruvyl transferase family protein n=1 Tax=Phaeobacter sp. BS23 TaxID=2907239 RepID=UPI0037044D3D